MTMASQDASKSYGFDGSFGEICGTTWYLSQVVIPGTNYMPKCMWIDANGDQPTTGFQYVLRTPFCFPCRPELQMQQPKGTPTLQKGNYIDSVLMRSKI